MSQHARVEEIEDSDPEEMDIDDVSEELSQSLANRSESLINPADIPNGLPAPRSEEWQTAQRQHKERTKSWQCLYPIYFDKTRTRQEGRRIGKELAVENPLAREIVDAVRYLGIDVVFEPAKTHPKDWANPGRVRCLVKKEGEIVSSSLKNKHHLYLKVAEHLRANPATLDSPMRLRIPGMPMDTKPPPPPAIPRGWKMNTILPLHSAAVSGGGVSENLFKDMMNDMQGGGQPSLEAGPLKAKKKKLKS